MENASDISTTKGTYERGAGAENGSTNGQAKDGRIRGLKDGSGRGYLRGNRVSKGFHPPPFSVPPVCPPPSNPFRAG